MNMASEKEFLIIIPVFNEEKYINDVINKVKENIDLATTDIVVIDDGSTNGTSQILKKIEKIKIITHPQNQGYGKSLIDGFNYAIENGYKYVITMDCDKQHEPERIKNFIKVIKVKNIDIVSGSRYMDFKSEMISKVPQDRFKINRKITEKLNKITKYNLTDAFCGFKAYKISALKKLNLTEPGYGMPIQLWIQAKINNLKIKEIPVDLIYLDCTRNFSNRFRSPAQRYRYYLKILYNELTMNKSLKDSI